MRRSALAVAVTAVLSPAVAASSASAIPSPWSTPVGVGVTGHTNLYPVSSMGAGGDLTVAVRDYTDDRVAVQSHPAGGTWSAATELSSSTESIGQYAVATSPADDAAVAIWGENTPIPMGMPGMTMPGPNQILVAARAAGGSWDAPVPLTAPAAGGSSPAVALAADGRAVALWAQNDGNVYASIRATDGTWSTATVVGAGSGVASDVAVGLRPDGAAVAIWSDNSAMRSAVLHGSTWSSVTSLGTGYSPRLGVDGDGVATISYTAGAGGTLEMVRSLAADDTWGTATQVSVNGAQAYYETALSVAPDGTAVVSWPQFDTGGSTYKQMASRRAADGTWSAPAVVGTGGSDTPAVTAADGGDAILTWQSDASGGPLTGSVFGSAWGTPFAISGGAAGSYADLEGDGRGTAAVAYMESGSTAKVSFFDGSGPDLRAVTVPSTATTGDVVSTSVSPVDAVSALGTTTWDFGDGSTTATGTSATHTYAAAGTYTVTVTSEDALGNASHTTRSITVSAPSGGGSSQNGGGSSQNGGGSSQNSGGSSQNGSGSSQDSGSSQSDGGTPSGSAPSTAAPATTTPSTGSAPAAAVVPAPPAAPGVQLAHRQKLATILARQAIRTAVAAPTAGTLTVTAKVSAATAKALGLKSTRLAIQTTKVKAKANVPVALRLSAAVRDRAAKLKSLTVTLTVTFTTSDGHTTTTTSVLSTRR